ncbi:MAG: tricarboxylic transporter [Hyphomicrobiales bacterium]|nr:tricarboxylic transporter [Hyphomicrobiales bacterium]
MSPSSGGARVARGELAVALGALALACVVLWQTLEIPVSPIYARVGPTIIPMITAVGLGVLSLLLIAGALRGGWQTDEEKHATPDRKALLWLAAGLLANVLLIGPAGFSVASVILFTATARAFGSTRPVRDAGMGLAFALLAYFGFARALGINIGAGLLERAIESVLGIAS